MNAILPKPGTLEIALYDLLGRQVYGDEQTIPAEGVYTFTLDIPQSYSAGLYILQMRLGSLQFQKKVTFLK